MKYLLVYILTGFTAVLASCNKALEEKPKSIAVENFYNTPAEVEAGVNAIYSPLRAGSCLGALYLVQVEIYGDYIYGRGSHAPLNDYAGLDNTNISRVAGMWQQFYQSIRNANLVIKNAPEGTGIGAADIARFVGEAKFMRALSYFYLVRNWAGVPLRTEENMDEVNVPRSSEADVYALIVQDLQFAEANLPDQPRLPGAPYKLAAKTVLADVYMYLKKYTEARDKTKEVIDADKFSLVNVSVADDFEKIFGADVASSTEEIFYLKFSRQSTGQGFEYLMYAHYPNSGYFPPGGYYTDYSDTSANGFIKGWDRKDLRFGYNWYYKTFGLGNATILNKKFKDLQAAGSNNAGNDYPMYRYADLVLLYAEAAARVNNGPTADAMEKLNMIHRRAYGKNPLTADASVDFKLADYSNLSPFLNLLSRERCYETCYEGKRWHELKRMGTVKEAILAATGKTVADKHLLWPIPTTEYNYNKAIDPAKDQNTGY